MYVEMIAMFSVCLSFPNNTKMTLPVTKGKKKFKKERKKKKGKRLINLYNVSPFSFQSKENHIKFPIKIHVQDYFHVSFGLNVLNQL